MGTVGKAFPGARLAVTRVDIRDRVISSRSQVDDLHAVVRLGMLLGLAFRNDGYITRHRMLLEPAAHIGLPVVRMVDRGTSAVDDPNFRAFSPAEGLFDAVMVKHNLSLSRQRS